MGCTLSKSDNVGDDAHLKKSVRSRTDPEEEVIPIGLSPALGQSGRARPSCKDPLGSERSSDDTGRPLEVSLQESDGNNITINFHTDAREESKDAGSAELKLGGAMAWYPTHATMNLLYNTISFDMEGERRAALESCSVLQDPEERFDVIIDIISALFDAPCAAISLIYDDTILAKSVKGPFTRCVEREGSICSYIIVPKEAKVLVVEDSTRDARFSNNPYVKGPPNLRYYSGCPLVATKTGHRYGTLCVLDFAPRPNLPPGMYNILCNFAEVTVREIERDTVASENDRSNHEEAFPPNSLNSIEINDRDVKAIHEAVFSINASQIDWPIQYANSAWCNLFQVSFKDVIGTSLWDIFDLASLQGNLDELKARVLSEGAPLRVSLKVHDGISVAESVGDCHAEVEFILASRDQLSGSVPVGIPSYISSDLYDHVGDVSNGSRDAKGNNNDDNNDIACQEEQTDELDTKRSSGDTGYNNLDESTNTMARQDFVSNIMASFWFGVVRFRSSTTKQSTVRSSAEISEKSRLYKSLSLSSSDRSHRMIKKPRILSHLQLGPLLGIGSYGRVYRGLLRNKSVAVKVIDVSEPVFGSVVPEVALQEALLSRRLAHPHIVPTLDFVIVDGDWEEIHHIMGRSSRNSIGSVGSGQGAEEKSAPLSLPQSGSVAESSSKRFLWIVQHLCNRGTLCEAVDMGWFRTELCLNSRPNLHAIVATALEIASALEYLHDEGMVHGDLSGHNVLLSQCDDNERGFIALVSDFGLSRGAANKKTNTIGTISYMPPETLTCGIVGQPGDVYAFGVLLWEMYQGRKAWAGCHMAQIIFFVSIQEKKLELPGDAPQVLKSLINLCLSTDPGCRPSFSVIKSVLQEYMNNEIIASAA